MQKVLSFIVAAGVFCALVQASAQPLIENRSSMAMQQLGQQPMAFTKNVGQWDEQVLYRANAGGATMWFAKDGAYYQFTRRVPTAEAVLEVVYGPDKPRLPHDHFDQERDSIESIMIKASFVGANPDPNMVGLEEMEYKCNYFIGNDPNEWHTDVPNYEYVLYQDVYPGIDLRYYGNGKQMEYDFIVSPGTDYSQIKIKYEGAKSLSVNEAGELEVETDWNTVTEQAPYVYQETGGGRREVVGKYRLLKNNTFGFALEKGFNSSLPLIIDPTLVYSTYLGGGDREVIWDIAVDGSGCAYVVGHTWSSDFPTQSPYQVDQGGIDVFVAKLHSSGTGLIYSTYIGGGNTDLGLGIAVENSGNFYVTGSTTSSDFPTQSHFQTYQGGSDAFVAKLSSSGNGLIYSTYLGGEEYDGAKGIAVDDSGSAYVTGGTMSYDFPTQNPYQADQDSGDVFVTKLSSSGNSLIYSTYLGGENADVGSGIAIDGDGNAYITGSTNSPDFPTENPYQVYQGSGDVFVTKLSSSGNSLIYSTYLGGSGGDYGYGIAVDGSGNAYITGPTWSSNFPTQNPCQTYQGSYEAFVTEFSNSGNSLIYSTYLGGSSDDYGYGIAVDGSGNTYVTGRTASSDFPTESPYQNYQGSYDAFVTKLASVGTGLIYSTYLGGESGEVGTGIAIDGSGNAFVTGVTSSSDFPTENPYQAAYQGIEDAFVTKLSETYGCLRGAIIRAGSSDTIPGATLWCTFGYGGTSDNLGQYSICQVSPGYGYSVGVYATGYVADTAFEVSISAGEVTVIDFALQPASFTSFRLRDLDVNPNPTVSTLVPGGKLHRHYILEDAISGTPVSGAQVLVPPPSSEQLLSNQDGMVDIVVISMDVDGGQSEASREFQISEISYDDVIYQLVEPVSFLAVVEDQRYELGWESSTLGKIGVSWLRYGEGRGSRIRLVETDNSNADYDSISFLRQERTQEGVGWGVHTPIQIVLNDYGVGAGIGAEAYRAKRFEDEYCWAYPTYSELDAVNMYILFADGNVQAIDQALTHVLSFLESIFTGQSSLEAAYAGESRGIEFSAGVGGQARYGPAEAIPYLLVLNVGGDIGYGFSSSAMMRYSSASETISVLLGLSGHHNAGAWAGIMLPFLNSSSVTEGLSNYILPTRLGFEGEVGSGVELGAHFASGQTDPYALSLGFVYSDVDEGNGYERSTHYQVSGEDVIEAIGVASEQYADLIATRSIDVAIDVTNGLFAGNVPDFFESANDIQLATPGNSIVSFCRNNLRKKPTFILQVQNHRRRSRRDDQRWCVECLLL